MGYPVQGWPVLVLLSVAAAAPAQTTAGPAKEPACTEVIPQGKARPNLSVAFPNTGTSGHLATLTVTVTHGRGETVFPGGVVLDRTHGGEELAKAGFQIPSPDALVQASKTTTDAEDGRAITVVKMPIVPLPPEAGDRELLLPELPIPVARASGELAVLCTPSKPIWIHSPIANEVEPPPRQNPEPVRQLEVWEAGKTAALIAAILLALALCALIFWLWWRRKPKPAPTPPPPRPPWELALEELATIRHADYPHSQESARHVDEVSTALKRYLGNRYRGAFSGMGDTGALESTTEEVLAAMTRVAPEPSVKEDVRSVLTESDLVKFAKATPTGDVCDRTLDRAEQIVRRTTPKAPPAPSVPTKGAPPKDGDS